MDILCIKARLAFVRYSRSMLHAPHFKNSVDELHSLDGGNFPIESGLFDGE